MLLSAAGWFRGRSNLTWLTIMDSGSANRADLLVLGSQRGGLRIEAQPHSGQGPAFQDR